MFNMRHVPMWRVSWHCGSMSVPGPLLTGSPTTRCVEIWGTSLALNFDLAYRVDHEYIYMCSVHVTMIHVIATLLQFSVGCELVPSCSGASGEGGARGWGTATGALLCRLPPRGP